MINDCGKKSLRVCAKINERENLSSISISRGAEPGQECLCGVVGLLGSSSCEVDKADSRRCKSCDCKADGDSMH